ncbi:MAG: penicillin-binding protein 1C [bacterium]|nr:penicillin-binding protein 1C [bacterium]MDZ4248389.1 penicillin-binding protein 1C [Patescibacteria group bacterium]
MRKVVSYHKKTGRAWLILAFVGMCVLVPILTFAGLADAVGPLFKLPTKENFHPTQTVFYDRHGQKLYETAGAHQPVPLKLSEVPRSVVLATLASEDADFYEHRGIDPNSLGRALYKTYVSKEPQGGSTITQQLIKNTYLSPERTASRKLREMTYAIILENRFSKDEILERYLNEVYYGQQSYGIGDAARTFFGKDVKELTLGESAMLAGLPSAPSVYSPLGGRADLAKQRQKYVLDRMQDLGYISAPQAKEAYAQKLAYTQEEQVFDAPHFVFFVKQQLAQYYGENTVDSGGLKVYTTLDLDTQRKAEEEVRRGVDAVRGYGATNGAAVVMDPRSGEVLAMVGSVDFDDESIQGKVNVAVSERQPGSSFKPIVYLTALRQGTPPNHVLHDRPRTFYNTFTPQNYDGRFRGNVTMRYALASSLNIPAVELLDEVGTEPVLDLAHQMGISTLNDPSRYGLSLVLGGGEVKLLDLTSAYSVLAAGGRTPGRATVTKVEGPKGKVLYQRKPEKKKVVDPGLAFILTEWLSDNRARSSGFGSNSILNFPRPAAVKTGTTNNYKDNWTIGYTPQRVVGVWVGNSDGTPMTGISGVQGAAPIWNALLQRVLEGLPVEDFKQPDNVYQSRAGVGALGGGAAEWFIRGTASQGQKVPEGKIEQEDAPPPVNGRYPYYYIDRNGKKVWYYQ